MSKYDSCELGLVVATYQKGNSVDVLLDDGSRLSNVQCLVQSGSDSSGHIDLVSVGGPVDDTRWDPLAKRDRYMRAIIGFYRRQPVVLGFLLPQVNQLTFSDDNRRVTRHPSDFYTTVDGKGNFEAFHPSGTYLRIGATPSHEDLTAKDVDKSWSIKNNTDAAVHVHLEVKNAGSTVASIDIDPNGNLAGNFIGNADLTVGGTCTINVIGNTVITTPNATVHASGSVTLDTPNTHCTGNLVVDGNALVKGALTYQGGMTGSGGSGAALTGNLAVTGGNVTADAIGLKTHHHTAQGATAATTAAQA